MRGHPSRCKLLVLPSNHRVRYPFRIVYFDTETRFNPDLEEQEHRFRLAVACRQDYVEGTPAGRSEWKVFKHTFDLWQWVDSLVPQRRTVWVCAHNMDFDAAASKCLSSLAALGWKVEFWAISWTTWLVTMRKGSRRLKLVDTLSLFRSSVERLGERVGIPKLKMPDPAEPDSVWEEYCKRDVEVLKLTVERFMEYLVEYDLGSLCLTMPSQALTTYRHKFCQGDVVIHHFSELQRIEREAYYGGRTEAFFIGEVPKSPIWYLDVRGMYAWILRDKELPIRFVCKVNSPTTRDVNQFLRGKMVIARVRVKLPWPCLPFRCEKVIFPVGEFDVTIPDPEFRYVWEMGWVKKVYFLLVYDKSRPFAPYAEYFCEEREKAKSAGDKFWDKSTKLYLNSLYGKFGQMNPIYKVVDCPYRNIFGVEEMVSTATGKVSLQMTFAGKTWVKIGEEPAWWTFFPICATVTSYARMRLWELIIKAGRDHVFYCDTDSVFVDRTGFERLKGELEKEGIGALEVEGVEDKMRIYGAKDYEFGSKRVLKGVPLASQEIDEGTYAFISFRRFRTRLRSGDFEALWQETKIRSRQGEYDKGIVTPSGWVEPYAF